jgi:hypothetical protein
MGRTRQQLARQSDALFMQAMELGRKKRARHAAPGRLPRWDARLTKQDADAAWREALAEEGERQRKARAHIESEQVARQEAWLAEQSAWREALAEEQARPGRTAPRPSPPFSNRRAPG